MFFFFTVYIRIILEAQQVILISSFSELMNVKYTSTNRIVSSIVAILHIALSVLFSCFILFLWASLLFKREKLQVKPKEQMTIKERLEKFKKPKPAFSETYLKEVFSGLKHNFKSKSYYLVSSSRTIGITALVVFTGNVYALLVMQLVFI